MNVTERAKELLNGGKGRITVSSVLLDEYPKFSYKDIKSIVDDVWDPCRHDESLGTAWAEEMFHPDLGVVQYCGTSTSVPGMSSIKNPDYPDPNPYTLDMLIEGKPAPKGLPPKFILVQDDNLFPLNVR